MNRPSARPCRRLPVASIVPVALGLALALAAPIGSAMAAAGAASTGVAWQEAASDADIARAFEAARAQHKPVLLYWGAVWCPPCNQLKATLFNRQDFAERSRSFVAVHLDGDAPGAQRLGQRFRVVGYPTLILFSPEGQELTRLPGEADAAQVMDVLQLGLASGRPIAQVLADARAGKPLPGADWRLLAFYSWDEDESSLVPAAERPALLARLAAACPPSEAEAGERLLLKFLVADADAAAAHAAKPAPDAATRQRVLAILADPARSRALMDVFTNSAPELVDALAPAPGAGRAQLVAATDAALARMQADATLSRADRMTALQARVDLARIDQKKDALHPVLPPALLQEARAAAADADREVTSPFERQAVITEASQVLADAGLWKESDALLQGSLGRSHSPYYLMSELGANARREGRPAEALQWYRKAFERSEGPATRLQWGAAYVGALVDLAPQDERTIEQAARAVFAEAAGQPGAFYERSGRSLQRIGAKLAKWNAGGRHQAAVGRLAAELRGTCAKLPAGDTARTTCDSVLPARA
ncbi:MAG: thioredoxin family protein [Burkholderiaceae bacterium]